jgi:mannose-6-phosphate isomerase-like protein (cupin superfamily)
VSRIRVRIRVSIVSGLHTGISLSSPGFLVQSFIASSSGTRLAAGAASLSLKLRRMMTRFLLFHQTQDTTRTEFSARTGDNMLRRKTMKNTALKVLITAAVLIPMAVYAQPRPGNPTTATVITKAEIDKISATEQSQRTRDENAKVVDIGDGWSMELGIIHRASTRNPPAPAAGAGNAQAAAQIIPCGEQMANPPADAIPGAITHDNQTEGYYIVSGGGTAFIDGHVVNGRHSTANPDGGPNGPGCGGLAVGSRKVELKVGDVLIVPPGVIHGWADIPDHVDYLSFRPSHGVMKNGWVNPTIASK